MAKYKVYPEYKNLGSEWLEKVPKSWKITRLKLETLINMGQSPSSDDCNIEGNGLAFLQGNAEFGKTNPIEKQYCPVAKKIANPGDILFSVRAPVGAINYADKEYGIGRGLCSITASLNTISSFLWWLLPTYKYQLDAIATGSTFEAVSAEQLGNLSFALPSIPEQLQITAFLYHETAKIDNLIEKQQQLIELLKEKRQAVISHAVTKGLNPDVPMKDSGVEWLGEVPEHWACTKIKYVSLLTPKKSALNVKINDECTFIPMDKLKKNSIVTDESKFIKEVINGYTYFEDNDLLLAKVTPCFENKNIAVAKGLVNGIGFGSTEIYVLRPSDKIQVNYLLYRLQEDNFIRAATGAMTGAGGLKRVPSEFLLNYSIAIPPKCEMNAIIDFLHKQEAHYDLVEKYAIQAVQLLQERRTALISAAVTGKIDVRDWVAPDTQETEKTEKTAA